MPEIDAAVVKALVAEQFPRWAALPVSPVADQGRDNRTFRLGDELSVRLPSAAAYAAAVEKEDAALPVLAATLPTPVPEPVGTGAPGHGYPFAWSVRRWLPGHAMSRTTDVDHELFARDLGAFLTHLQAAPTEHGPPAGKQSFFRGCHPSVYSDEVDRALRLLADCVDVRRCRHIWHDATTTVWSAPPVWLHGDLDLGNLLVREGRLGAVIDFGCCAIGDPACDLALAWTYFSGPARRAFRESLDLDVDTWRRARGWVLWKALVTIAGMSTPDSTGSHERHLTEALEAPMP